MRLGLSVGQPLADARALVPDLIVADSEPAADAASLIALTEWCTRYSPWAAPDGEDGIRLDITGCAHLFGGETGIVRDMARRLRGFGIGTRGAIADTPAAAWGWARYRPRKAGPILRTGDDKALMSLPVAALRLQPDSLETLAALGLDTVGTVAALPRGPLTHRLGEAVLERLDRMFGRAAEPISPRAIAEPWISRLIFAEPIGRREDIDAATERLLANLCREMEQNGQGARRLLLAFYRVDGAVQHIAVGTSHPSHTQVHIMRLFAERLDSVAPGFGIEAMVLEATETEPLVSEQTGFSVSGEMDTAALARLIDRLQNRLGPQRVVRLVPVESHVPERAERRAVAGPSGRHHGKLGTWSLPQSRLLKSLRPLTLLPIPEPIQAIAPVPDDPPLSFRWKEKNHRIAAADGPERIGPEWWLAEGGRKPRDYYRVENSEGQRFWVYREGLYGDEKEPPRWFLHGFFP